MKRIPSLIPAVVSGLIAISAVTLFVHTASSRRLAAQARDRVAAGQASLAVATPVRDAAAGNPANSLRQTLSLADRRSLMAKRLDSVRTVANSVDRTRALLALIREFEPGDFKLAMDECKAAPKSSSDSESFPTILEEWSGRDPLAALAYAARDPSMKTSILGTWAGTDPESALNWARQDAGEGSGDGLAGKVVAAIANSDPQFAMDHLAGLSAETRQETLKAIISAGDSPSARAVVDWIGTIQDAAERAAVVKMAYENWDTYDTLEQKYALFETYPETLSDQNIARLFSQWAEVAPQAVSAAIDRIPQGDLRQAALDNAIDSLISGEDRKRATEMVAKYRDELSDEALGNKLANCRDPDTALQMADLIGDAGIRANASATVLHKWAEDAPDDAREWMDRHDAPPSVREKFAQLSKRENYRSGSIRKVEILEAVGR